jgi:hypothetical protein
MRVAMSDKQELENRVPPTPREIFEGIKHRAPKTEKELEEWLASGEGKAATAFQPNVATRWGEGRS